MNTGTYVFTQLIKLLPKEAFDWIVKNGRSCKPEELCIGEKLFDGFVILPKLRTVAFVKDEYHALVA